MSPVLTSALARAAAHDAGDRSMRRAGRLAWSEDDWNAAAAEFVRLLAIVEGTGSSPQMENAR